MEHGQQRPATVQDPTILSTYSASSPAAYKASTPSYHPATPAAFTVSIPSDNPATSAAFTVSTPSDNPATPTAITVSTPSTVQLHVSTVASNTTIAAKRSSFQVHPTFITRSPQTSVISHQSAAIVLSTASSVVTQTCPSNTLQQSIIPNTNPF